MDLSVLARQLDEAERAQMAKGDVQSKEYLTFLEQPSGNVDDSGFFSVQVLSEALKAFHLDLVAFNSEECKASRNNPLLEQAYICNHQQHWLTLRRIGSQWFNLDSILLQPELVSDMYLSLLLEQLRQEGYSIFAVRGDLPGCEAHDILLACPVDPKELARLKPVKMERLKPPRQSKSPSFDDVSSTIVEIDNDDLDVEEDEDYQLALAISASLQDSEKQGEQSSPLEGELNVPVEGVTHTQTMSKPNPPPILNELNSPMDDEPPHPAERGSNPPVENELPTPADKERDSQQDTLITNEFDNNSS